jgi:hypothetical protein
MRGRTRDAKIHEPALGAAERSHGPVRIIVIRAQGESCDSAHPFGQSAAFAPGALCVPKPVPGDRIHMPR